MVGILLSVTKLKVVASSPTPNDPSSSSSPSLSQQPNNFKMKPKNKVQKTDYKKQLQQKQQPSILEIERAIGAGIFRDRDVNSGGEEKRNNLLDNILKNSVGENEGDVEKQLRETGEWLIQQTETTSRSAGKQILIFIFVWMIPTWVIAFLVATGLLPLPFHTPFLDDLIS